MVDISDNQHLVNAKDLNKKILHLQNIHHSKEYIAAVKRSKNNDQYIHNPCVPIFRKKHSKETRLKYFKLCKERLRDIKRGDHAKEFFMPHLKHDFAAKDWKYLRSIENIIIYSNSKIAN